MKTVKLLLISDKSIIRRYEFTRHESEVFTLLANLSAGDVEFTIECADGDAVSVYGLGTDSSSLSINQLAPLKKEGSNILLPLETTGIYYFHLNFSDEMQPTLRVKAGLESRSAEGTGLDHFLDAELPLSLELGRAEMSIDDVLSLEPGSIIELHRLVGEELEVFVGEKLVATAEVMVVGDEFGARLTKVLPVVDEIAETFNLSPEE